MNRLGFDDESGDEQVMGLSWIAPEERSEEAVMLEGAIKVKGPRLSRHRRNL